MPTAMPETTQRPAIETPMTSAPAVDERPALAEKVTIRDLCFFYDQNQALKNISLPLYDKQVTAFIGPSGCGKSTLLRVSTGSTTSTPSSGRPARCCWMARTSCRRSRI